MAARGDWARVVEIERQRIDSEPDASARAAAWTRVGQVREEKLDDSDGAAEAYTQAIEADAGFVPALEGAARLYAKNGTVDKLVWMHRAEAASAPSPAERAAALLHAGELLAADAATLDEGIAALEEARALAPTASAVFLALERALRKKGAYETLCTLYRSEVDRGVEPLRAAWLLTQLGELAALRLGDPKRAIEAFSIAAGLEGDGSRYALFRLAQLLEDADAPAELEPVLARLGTLTDDKAEQASLLERAARLQEQRGDVDAALASYRQALELAPPGHTVYAAAGRAFARAERWSELVGAVRARHAAAARAPSARTTPIARACCSRASSAAPTKACERLHETLALEPRHRRGAPGAGGAVHRDAALERARPRARRSCRRARRCSRGAPRSPRRAAVHEEALSLWDAAYAAGADAGDAAAGAPVGAARPLERAGRAARARAGQRRRQQGRAATRAIAPPSCASSASGSRRAPSSSSPPPSLPSPTRMPLLLAQERVLDAEDAGATRRAQGAGVAHARSGAARGALGAARRHADRGARWWRRGSTRWRCRRAIRSSPSGSSRRSRRGATARGWRRCCATCGAIPRATRRCWRRWRCSSAALLEELGSLARSGRRLRGGARARRSRRCWRAWRCRGSTARSATMRAPPRRSAGWPRRCPPGPSARRRLRKLAAYHRDRGDSAAAIATLDQALQAHPRDYAALRALDILCFAAEPERLIDPLMRAFAAEPPSAQRSAIGSALAVRLMRANRMAPAREVLEEVLADDAAHLNALVLQRRARGAQRSVGRRRARARSGRRASRRDRRRSPPRRCAAWRACSSITSTTSPPRAPPPRGWARSRRDELSSLEVRLVVAERADDHADAARLLGGLIAHAGLDDDRRAQLQLQLASLQEVKLDDVAAAIQTLGEIKLPAHRRDAVDRLFDLGGRANRWDLAASALEATLDRAGAMEPAWELAIRSAPGQPPRRAARTARRRRAPVRAHRRARSRPRAGARAAGRALGRDGAGQGDRLSPRAARRRAAPADLVSRAAPALPHRR